MNTSTLTHYLPHAVKLTALGAFVFAVLKIVLIAQSYGVFVALVFAGLHLPLCLFSLLFVLWFFDLHQGFGFLALVSALFNALLI
ncbi:hypothetical protein SAMN02745130_02720 [Thiothrix eikelboomii]|uniref:Uncharacterized protein n=1 Tax=Thiothrix eikelboomii TaxID=92487 RepID=A0A1T4XA50_9GAMM|nr:hypothetical protein [Thiothrix eikelboomii]SKA86492.1 hypothetical protein SAMN02745130_02720 [Thiothrix eikelboomii]